MCKKISLKNVASIVLIVMFVFSIFTNSSFAFDNFKDGQYEISVKAINAQTGELSKMNDSIKNPAIMEVKSGQIFIIMEFADTSYDLAADDGNGGFAKAEVISENEASKTFTYKFPVKNIDEPVLMQTVVAAMGTKVNFKLAFDKDSIVNIIQQNIIITKDKDSIKETENNSQNENIVNKSTSETNTQPQNKSTFSTNNATNPKTGNIAFAFILNIFFAVVSVLIVMFTIIYKNKQKYASE